MDNNDGRFVRWLKAVDHYVVGSIGLGIDDLPDQDYRAYFDAGLSAKETADEIVEIEFDDVFETGDLEEMMDRLFG